MSTNFNIVGSINKINTSNDENNENKSPKKNDNNDMKKRMAKFMLMIIGGMAILLVVLLFFSLFNKKDYSYTDLENILKKAAISYFKDNKNRLPENEEQIVEIEAATLVASEKMKDLSEYTKEGTSCSGRVLVEKKRDEYLYTPYLDCGDTYTTKELYQEITKQSNVVTSGYGLYNNNGTYVYRGENVNNYLKLDKTMWRIVKITADNNILLIKDEEIANAKPWDNRYNQEINYTAGINNYKASRIKDYLENSYKASVEKEEPILSKEDKSKLTSFNLCIGKRAPADAGADNSMECSEVLSNQMIGLLTLSEYMQASIDSGCINSTSKACQNYNYLTTDFNWWLATASTEKTYEAYVVERGGNITTNTTSGYADVRPVIQLNSKALYESGNGSKEKPYKIK